MSKRMKVPRRVPPVQLVTATALPTVSCGGKTWKLGFNTQDAKGRLEELIRAHVVRDALKNKRAVGGDEGEEVYRSDTAPLRKGYYATFARGWVEIVNSPVGAVLYLQSLLLDAHPDATEADALRLLGEEPEQTQAAIEAVSPDFFAAVAAQLGATPEGARAIAAAIVEQTRARRTAEPGGGSP